MIWLTWRQYRFEVILGAVTTACLALVLVLSGTGLDDRFHQSGLAACLANATSGDPCSTLRTSFLSSADPLKTLLVWLNFVPLLIGLLLAAPMALELEQGTYRLAWTQSVTRSRWLAVRLAFGIGLAAITAALITALLTWWRSPLDQVDGRFRDGFSFEGTVFVSYTLFALALCLFFGSFLRRTVPAMGVSAVLFVLSRLAIENYARPHFLAPITRVQEAGSNPELPPAGAWLIHGDFVDKLGTVIQPDEMFKICGPGTVIFRPDDSSPGALQSLSNCIGEHGILGRILYQPADRFWIFQGIESALFLGATALLLGLTVWMVTKRLAR